MYECYFGLHRKPFEVYADREFYFESERTRETAAAMIYGLKARRGLQSLVGGAGTGKTTLLRMLCASFGDELTTLVVAHSTLDREEFLAALCHEIDLSYERERGRRASLVRPRDGERTTPANGTRVDRLMFIRHFVEAAERDGKAAPLLIIDEAQGLSDEVLEEIRLLSNLESSRGSLLQIILAGQPSLRDRIERPTASALKQRIAVPLCLEPLDPHETKAYVAHRLAAAGADVSTVFSERALDAIAATSGGIPRLINMLCDWCLVNAYGLQRRRVDESLVLESRLDLDVSPESFASPCRRLKRNTASQPALPWPGHAPTPPRSAPPRAYVAARQLLARAEPLPAYGVLVATYRVYSKARAHASQLLRSGHEASAVRSKLPNGNPVTQVVVGVGTDVERVRESAERLAHDGIDHIEVTRLEGWTSPPVRTRVPAGGVS